MKDEDHDSPSLTEEEVSVLRETLVRAAQKVCPYWLRHMKEDIVQVGLLRVLEVQRKSETKRTFTSSYLFRTAYSAVVDEIRRQQRRQETPMEQVPETSTHALPNPEQIADGRQKGQAILECLKALVLSRQRAMTLALRGYRVPEIAEFLGWDGKRAKNLVFRGYQDLRECLARKGYAL